MFMRHKVSVIGGAGNVGASAALEIARRDIADVVMLDLEVVRDKTIGRAHDTSHAGSILGYHTMLIGTSDYEDIADSDVVIVTAGLPRKPGMTRDDLLDVNSEIILEVGKKISKYAPEAIVLVVTNPLDAMVYVMLKSTGFDRKRVIGMSGELDTARFRDFLSKKLNISRKDIDVTILGGHGDKMVPVPEASSVRGIGLSSLISKDDLDDCIQRTVTAGGDVTKLMGTSAFVAPGIAIAEMVSSVLLDQKRVFSASTLLTGKEKGYGDVRDVCIGVPVVIGKDGIERVLPIKMEKQTFEKYMDSVRKEMQSIRALKI
jgi:malate dehydrogenase